MSRTFLLLFAFAVVSKFTSAQTQAIPTPKEHFGFAIGDDYQLATYTQTEAYFRKLAASDRVKLVDIGLTEEGRHQLMLIVTSPENHKKLDRYKEISTQLARAEGVSEEQAKAMAAEGKAVVWIDGGLHATETVGASQLIETAYELITRTDAETLRILDKVVILLTHANPDGQELVSSWYMRNTKPEQRSLDHLPRLYQKYIGHDNNRDFFIMNMKETQNMGRQLFVEWIPQIMYNHHQSGPGGSVLAGPPYRDPFNYVFEPGMITGIDALGAAMISRLNTENKPGYTRLGGSVFSTWYNGGLRTTTLSQHDWPLDRNCGKPYSWGYPSGSRTTHSQQQHTQSGCATEVVLQTIHRLFALTQLCGVGLCSPQQRSPAVQHLSHGQKFY